MIGSLTRGSLNYERKIASKEKVTWYGRIGVGHSFLFLVTVMQEGTGGVGAITMLRRGKKNGHLEVSAGVFVGKGKKRGLDINEREVIFGLPIFNVGYRYQKPESGFIFSAKAGVIAVGISLGYAF